MPRRRRVRTERLPATAATITAGEYEDLVLLGFAHPSGRDDDFFLIEDVPPAHLVAVDIFLLGPSGHVALEIETLGSGASVSNGFSGERRLVLANVSGAPQDFQLWFSEALGYECTGYGFRAEVIPDPCQIVPDDVLEDNDSCIGAPVLPTGTYSNLFLSPTDEDVFRVDVPAGQVLIADQLCSSSRVYVAVHGNDVCTDVRDSSGGGTSGVRTARYENRGASTVTMRVRNWIVGDRCATYDLSLTLAPAPCASAVDDAFEPNDDCASAAPVGAGLANLFVSETDPDHYRVGVPAGGGLTIDLPFDAAGATPSLRLFTGPSCAQAVGEIAGGHDVVTGEWTNDTGVTQ